MNQPLNGDQTNITSTRSGSAGMLGNPQTGSNREGANPPLGHTLPNSSLIHAHQYCKRLKKINYVHKSKLNVCEACL